MQQFKSLYDVLNALLKYSDGDVTMNFNDDDKFIFKDGRYLWKIPMSKDAMLLADVKVSVEKREVSVSCVSNEENEHYYRYLLNPLPDDADEQTLEATLKDDGIYITANKKESLDESKEKKIKINYV